MIQPTPPFCVFEFGDIHLLMLTLADARYYLYDITTFLYRKFILNRLKCLYLPRYLTIYIQLFLTLMYSSFRVNGDQMTKYKPLISVLLKLLSRFHNMLTYLIYYLLILLFKLI